MGKKSGPPAPDYTGAANAQAAQSQANTTQQTWANRPDQSSPFGNITWGAQETVDPSTGQKVTKWTQNTTLDPEVQGALDSQMQTQRGRSDLANSMMGGVGETLGTPMDWGQFGSQTQGPNAADYRTNTGNIQTGLDFSGVQGVDNAQAQRQRAEDAAYQSQTARLDPRFAQQQRQMETDLANRGISRNSEAYSRAMADFERSKNDAYSNAQLGAINVGGAEAQRNYGMDMGLRQQQVGEIGQQGQFGNQAQAQMFGQGMTSNAQNFGQQMQSSQYANQLRQQQIAEAQQQRGMGLNEMNALLSGQQVQNPQFQNFGQAGAAQTPDLLGAASAQYGGALNQQSGKNAMFGDILGGIGSMAAMYYSDARVKRDVRRIGRHPRGFGVYRYRYVGERGTRVGVMAQEVRRYMPEAVHNRGGVLMVDYSMIGGLNG
jgi:hypothetical protein